MRVSYLDIARTHEDNPECPQRITFNPQGGAYCIDCGKGILWSTIEVMEKALVDKITNAMMPNGVSMGCRAEPLLVPGNHTHDLDGEVRQMKDIKYNIRRVKASDEFPEAVSEVDEEARIYHAGQEAIREIDAERLKTAAEEGKDFCSQCGQSFSAPACGPTHASIAHERKNWSMESLGVAFRGQRDDE